MRIAAHILRALFALLLLATASGKLLDMAGFAEVVASYRMLPPALVTISAWALALTELALAAWLILGRWLDRAALAVLGLHLMFLGWTSVALARGLQLPNCGCFGVYWARPLGPQMLIEDGVLVLLAAALWVCARRSR